MTRPLLLTRARDQALEFAKGVRANTSFSPHIAPMQEMQDLPVDINLTSVSALAFTSKNGVRSFANRSELRELPALCVGAATADLAASFGFQVQTAGGDAASLTRLVAAQPGKTLHLHGTHVRTKVSPNHLAIYAQQALDLDPNTLKMLDNHEITDVALFSLRSAELFLKAWDKPMNCFCISAAAAGVFSAHHDVKVADAPNAAAMLRLLSADNL